MISQFLLSLVLILSVSSCTVYRSPERKNFESEYAAFKTKNLSAKDFKTKNLSLQSCSDQSVAQFALASRLVTTIEKEILHNAHQTENQTVFIWEHIVSKKSIFESNNANGEYCIYEYHQN